MLTFEKVLSAFKDYLSEDTKFETNGTISTSKKEHNKPGPHSSAEKQINDESS